MNAANHLFRLTTGALLIGGLAGCRTHDDWFPMALGKHWTYQVRTGFDSRIESIRVLRPLTVASADGYELSGPLGVSRLAWKHGALYADSTVNARFSPPLPLLVSDADLTKDVVQNMAKWHGRVVVLGKERPGSAVLTEQTAKIEFGSQKVSTILATLTLSLQNPDSTIELQSWYREGIGLVHQEQRTRGSRIVQLQLLDRGAD